MKPSSTFDSLVVKLMLKFNSYGIKEIIDLSLVVSLLYVAEDYERIRDLIQNNKTDELKLMESKPADGFREYLEIMSFKDQHSTEYIVTIYDSDELWQNPEMIEIFRLRDEPQ